MRSELPQQTGRTSGPDRSTAAELHIFTIGHSTRSIAEFAALLQHGCVDLVVDVRTVPRSRHNPQYNEDVIGAALAEHQVGYSRIADLGGLRGRSAGVSPEVNGFWINKSFHNYADYALSERFDEALLQFLRLAEQRRCALMCAEAVWWRCHRRIIADYLLVRGHIVTHLMGADRLDPATLTPAAKVRGLKVCYPAT